MKQRIYDLNQVFIHYLAHPNVLNANSNPVIILFSTVIHYQAHTISQTLQSLVGSPGFWDLK